MPSGSPALVRWVHVVVKFRSKTMRREILANRRMLCRKFAHKLPYSTYTLYRLLRISLMHLLAQPQIHRS